MKLRYVENIVSLEYKAKKCTGCTMCAQVCPRNVFVMENKKAKIADLGACIECGACMTNCAYGAIKVETGPGCAAAILSSKGGKAECGCRGNDKKYCC